eukprot:COSAG01_NODE_7903_length_2999_cov_3.954483_5_plen_62_part_00
MTSGVPCPLSAPVSNSITKVPVPVSEAPSSTRPREPGTKSAPPTPGAPWPSPATFRYQKHR